MTTEMASALRKRGRTWGARNGETLAQLRDEVRPPITARIRWWRDRMLGLQAIGDGAFLTRHPNLDALERQARTW